MLITVLYIIGITAEGMTGAIAAGRQKMDIFGVVMIAEMTALGGGSIRDALLGHYPLTWVHTPEYLLVVGGAAMFSVMVSPVMIYLRKLFLMLDAIGLSVFTVLGIEVARSMGYGFIIALVAAVVTGVFGGVLRDIFSNRIPLVFRTELYATCVLAGVTAYWVMMHLGVNQEVNTIATLSVVFAIRMLALRFGWSLPVFNYQERPEKRSPANQIWRRIGKQGNAETSRKRANGKGSAQLGTAQKGSGKRSDEAIASKGAQDESAADESAAPGRSATPQDSAKQGEAKQVDAKRGGAEQDNTGRGGAERGDTGRGDPTPNGDQQGGLEGGFEGGLAPEPA